MKKKLSKKVTMDDLAIMVQGGFTETNGRIYDLRKDMKEGFDRVDKRFDIIENKLISQHTTEIDHLRDKVMQLEVKFATFSKK